MSPVPRFAFFPPRQDRSGDEDRRVRTDQQTDEQSESELPERERTLEVSVVIDKRVGAAVAATCLIDHSPPVPVVKREPRVFVRERGTGRPTKRERRELDRLKRP